MGKTLRDIASELHVSASTISRVVNGRDNVNEKTRKRIMSYLESNKYAPNQVARSLKKNSTKTVGVIVPDICEIFFGQIIKGIDEIVSAKDYSIILVDSCESKQKESRYIELLYRQRVDALVIATVDINDCKVTDFLDDRIPVVFIDNIPNLSVPFDAVLIDNVLASKMAVQHLADMGHREVAMIVGSPEETTGHDRLLGYQNALRENGLSVNDMLISYGNYKENAGYNCMCSLLENREQHPFTAVYVAAEMMTVGAIKAIKEHGLSIPNDISIVGFDVHDRAQLMSPGITTMRQHEHQLGRLVGALLMERLKEKKAGTLAVSKQKTLLIPYLEVKESSSKPLAKVMPVA